HLDLLVTYIKTIYTSTKQRFNSLEYSGEITYNILWALFKPNHLIYRKCLGTRKPRYIKFNFSKERTSYKGEEFFYIKG
ncbi:uncharacterized protein K441DRAFT_557411, partial [Cenococcum geophilum 1.58]|uniref:uncharacterized protein n=1 Tax=Cenococcum geophilum 1.58 TaxID=794803 RepID=UPI00358F81C3